MNSLPIRNTLRAVLGHLAGHVRVAPARPTLYVNLRGSSATGGPHRFLRNFSGELARYDIRVTNWAVRGASAALVFSCSWGNSFTSLCRRCRVRSVLRVDGFFIPGESEYPITESQQYVNERLKQDLRRFDHVIYQSAYSKARADEHLIERSANYSIIHNGVDTEYFRPVAKDGCEAPTIVVLGKHYPSHLKLAAEVFRQVRHDRPARLLIIGPLRDGSPNVRETFQPFMGNDPAMNDVEFAGTVRYEQLPETLARGDLFLHVKVGDWCPNAVTEALSSGLPVVCPEFGGTKELVRDGGLSAAGAVEDGSLSTNMAEATCSVMDALPEYQKAARGVALRTLDRAEVTRNYLQVLGFSEPSDSRLQDHHVVRSAGTLE